MAPQPSAGTKLYMGTTASVASSDTYTEIGSLSALPSYGAVHDNVPFENLSEARYDHNTGAENAERMTVSIGRDFTDSGQSAVRTARGVNSYYNFKVMHPNNTVDYFKAKVQGVQTAPGGLTGNTMANLILQPKPGTFSENNAGAAPVNTVLPSIAGIAQVGVTLTALPGTWSQPATFSYQWKNGGVNISGATEAAYVPVVGDVGDTLTVTVTATNSTGSASATSGGTADVLAA